MPKPIEASGGTRRIQMEMPPKSVERLKRLQEITEAASYAEVMRNALRLYESLIEETAAGHQILVKRGDTIAPLTVFAA